ncbi:MAG TPA: PIG-L family deacetylase, partial [Anaerolineales bacterium]|nr:PIG-L family deacetylase [Anaerolineales bacterium]
MTVSNSKTLVAILAHPDDESFGMGGTLALYAKQGAKVYYICMTGGESGTVEPHFLENYNSIAELRYQELKCASEKLGLAGFIMAGYRDSGMPGSPDNAHPEALVNQPVEAV